MSAVLFHEPVFATIVESGDQLYFYEVGTTSDLPVYLNASLSTPAPQPLTADAQGRFPPVYMDSTGNPPKVVLEDANSVEKWTTDEYPFEDVSAVAGTVAQIQEDLEDAEGAILSLESTQSQQQSTLNDHEDRIEDLEAIETGIGLVGSGARVRRTSDQTAFPGQITVQFNTTDFDDGNMVSSNVLTVPSGVSRVIVTAQLRWQQNSTGNFSAFIRRNNSGFSGQPIDNRYLADAPVGMAANLSTGILSVSAGDTFQLVSDNAGGSSSTIQSGTWMNMVVMK